MPLFFQFTIFYAKKKKKNLVTFCLWHAKEGYNLNGIFIIIFIKITFFKKHFSIFFIKVPFRITIAIINLAVSMLRVKVKKLI